ncbi:MAG: SAM-dependent chlorinase/fluorinase [Clostridia bacterium]|nr:SAM-dependent chlorinase/fluorinase [Clostridia bacterium]
MYNTILLQTDFSLAWGAVSSMKGVIKRTAPDVSVEDICHDIKSFDPFEASLSLKAVLPFWPDDTITVSVVDPGVGTERKASAALLANGKIVITPDNGTLTHLKHDPGIACVRTIDEKYRYPSPEKVSVFHGRDIFAYAAALIASGKIDFHDIGDEYPVSEIIECPEYHEKPSIGKDSISCFIMTGNRHFGGIEFSVTNEQWDGFAGDTGSLYDIRITCGDNEISFNAVPYEESFGHVEKGHPLIYRGSSGYLSMDLNQDHLINRYSLGTGIEWKAVISAR